MLINDKSEKYILVEAHNGMLGNTTMNKLQLHAVWWLSLIKESKMNRHERVCAA